MCIRLDTNLVKKIEFQDFTRKIIVKRDCILVSVVWYVMKISDQRTARFRCGLTSGTELENCIIYVFRIAELRVSILTVSCGHGFSETYDQRCRNLYCVLPGVISPKNLFTPLIAQHRKPYVHRPGNCFFSILIGSVAHQ